MRTPPCCVCDERYRGRLCLRPLLLLPRYPTPLLLHIYCTPPPFPPSLAQVTQKRRTRAKLEEMSNRDMRRFVSIVLLFLLWLAGGPCVLAEHRCIFDRVASNWSQLQTAVVQELPRGRAGAWQAYTVATSDWAPIRIKVFTEDLKDTTKYCTVRGDVRSDFTGGRVLCRRQDVLTKEKMEIMVNRLLPEAVKLHTERLLVQPVSGVLRLPRFNLGVCGEFTVPITHHLSGVVGADMLLYAAAAPTIGETVAWASTCVTLQDGRPAAGVLNFSPSFIAPKRESIRVVSHEIAHALGFNSILMWRLGMISMRSDVRGKAITFVVDSNEIIQFW
ncbi:surface protease GP63, putative, partial [Trypanosoma cruzi marinkellei]